MLGINMNKLDGGVMENPEKIEIEGLKTIHKLCKFGADHNMEGCTFAEIVERMFSKIEQMKSQVNTLDEMLLNQGEALAQAKARAVPEGYVLMPIKPTETMVMAVVKEHEGDAFLPYSLYDAYVKQAMIEAQEPAND